MSLLDQMEENFKQGKSIATIAKDILLIEKILEMNYQRIDNTHSKLVNRKYKFEKELTTSLWEIQTDKH